MSRNAFPTIVPASYTGVSFLLSWIYLLFYANTAGVVTAAPILLNSVGYTVSAVFMMATLLVFAFFIPKRNAVLTDARTKIATALVMAVGSALLIAGGFSESGALLFAGGAASGVASGLMALQWAVAYSRVGLRVAVNSFPTLMAISVGVCITLMHLPQQVLLAATVVLPLVSELMFHEVRKQPWPEFEEDDGEKNRPINFILMVLPFAVFALASGFLDFSSSDNNYTFAFYAIGAFVPFAIAGVFMFLTEPDGFMAAFIVPLCFLVVACVPFLSSAQLIHTPFASFISIGELGIEVLIFIVAVGFAQFFSLDAVKSYALGRVTYTLANGVGWYLAGFANASFGELFHSQLSLVVIFAGVEVLAVGLIVAIVKARKDSGSGEEGEPESPENLGDEGQSEDLSGGEQVADLVSTPEPFTPARAEGGSGEEVRNEMASQAIQAIALGHGLSQREVDVFRLLARGYTSSRIQSELFIAAGTVNYHTRNIYAKLGVHSKQELIQLFEREIQQG